MCFKFILFLKLIFSWKKNISISRLLGVIYWYILNSILNYKVNNLYFYYYNFVEFLMINLNF